MAMTRHKALVDDLGAVGSSPELAALGRRIAWRRFVDRRVVAPLRWTADIVAAALLLADLLVVSGSVVSRFAFSHALVWADDVARLLMVALAFFGAAGALARDEATGISAVVRLLPPAARDLAAAFNALIVLVVSLAATVFAFQLAAMSAGQTTGSGLPQVLYFYPMAVAALFMTVFSAAAVTKHGLRSVLVSAASVGGVILAYGIATLVAPDFLPNPLLLMLGVFVLTLMSGMSIGFVLAAAALAFIMAVGWMPGMIFAQQMVRGIDTFVLLAIPFFILVGYLLEANGMSLRLIALLEGLVGRVRGGLNVVMVLSMVVFSGISGSKLADVAAVGTVLIPAARKSRQDPGDVVGLLAASAVMAETIPPCINLIILGFVANISIGGLFVAGLAPAALMAAAMIGLVVWLGDRPVAPLLDAALSQEGAPRPSRGALWLGAAPTLGLVLLIFFGFKSGFATATEISAFGALYALLVGPLSTGKMRAAAIGRAFIHSAVRAGLVLFIIAASQAVAYTLTLEEVPRVLADSMIAMTQHAGSWVFILMSIAILIVMGSMLEGAAALIIFGPLLVPVATQLGVHELHYGIILVIAMGLGLFAPPLGMGLYSACLIGAVPIEATVRPMIKYLGLLLACLLVIAFVPALTLWLPKAAGY